MGNNQLSHGNVEANDFIANAGGGNLSTALQQDSVAANKAVRSLQGSVARTDTSAKTLGTLPANAVITGITISSTTGSDAGTTATLSLGKSGGTGTEYLNGQSIKGAGTIGQLTPSTLAAIGSVGGSAVTVQGTYAETGTASTTGGPWLVCISYTST